MKFPFLWVALGFSSGIAVERYGGVPSVWPACVLGAGIPFLWLSRTRKLFLPLFVILLSCAGFLCSRLDAYAPASAIQNFTGPGRVVLRGIVNSLPEVKTRGKKITVSLALQARSVSRRDQGRWRSFKARGEVQAFLIQSQMLPQVGDELRLYGELKAPRPVLNPGEFDYGNFLAQKNIHAVFQSIGTKSVRLVRSGSWYSPARILAEARRRLASSIDRLYHAPESAILKALVLGLRSDVPASVRSQFMKTGTIHLFATANTKRDFAPFSNKIIATYSP